MLSKNGKLADSQVYALFMQTPVGFGLLAGPEHCVKLANNAFLSLTGRGEDSIGKPVTEVFPEIAIQGYLKLLDKVIQDKQTIRLNESPAIFLKNGTRELYYLNFVFQPYFVEGEVTGILTMVNDVTTAITARKIVEEREERLRLATETTKLGTWEYLPLTGKLTWSDECKRIYEFPLDQEVDYELFSAHIHPGDRSFAQRAIETAMDPGGQGSYDIEYRILRYTDKAVRWIRAQGKVFFNAEKQPVKFIGTVLDITDARKKEEELRMNEERLRLAVAGGRLGTYELDLVTSTIICSPRLAEIFGLNPEDNIGHEDLRKALHPDDVIIRDKAHQQASETGSLFYEARVIWKDGSIHWIRLNGKLVFDTHGNALRIYGTALDITKQKETERILKESQEKFELIADAIPHMVWEIELDGTVSYINKQWADWSDLTLEEINQSGWSMIIHPDELAAVKTGWQNSFLHQVPFMADCRFRNPVGGYTWFTLKTLPIKNEKGETELWIGSATDIHDKKLNEQQKDEFISMASHELKTPVTTIKAYGQVAEGMLERKGDTETLLMIKKMGKQVNKLTTLIEDLLDISKIEQGKLRYNKTSFDFNELVKEVIGDMQQTSLTHKIICELEPVPPLFGDRDKLGQVINNLLSNAIKYSPGASRIEVKLVLKDHDVVLSVRDYGIGIPITEQVHVFEQFFRVNGGDQSTFPGMGIGLYICSGIIKSHQGEIMVESKPGIGSTFTVRIPL